MINFIFASAEEIQRELAQRLRAQRLAQHLPQKELAARAGLSLGAIHKLENSGSSSLETLVRVAQALGLLADLQTLFALPRQSIAQMEQAQRVASKQRVRAPRKSSYEKT